MTTYFNVKDFADIQLSKNFAEDRNCQVYNASAHGKQENYDVFISHSSKDKDLIKKLRSYLEDYFGLSAYIDWDEDCGMSREEVADRVKEAMSRSKTFLIVKTDNSDKLVVCRHIKVSILCNSSSGTDSLKCCQKRNNNPSLE